MSLTIKTLSLPHQWFVFILAKNDILMPETAEEILEDLGVQSRDFAVFAQAVFDFYTATFSAEDQNAALPQFEDWSNEALKRGEAGEVPNFTLLDSADDNKPSSAEIARALNELHTR